MKEVPIIESAAANSTEVEDFRIGSEELQNLPHTHKCFKIYKPWQILKYNEKEFNIAF